MNFLFIHQNFPGQFKLLAPFLGAHKEHTVVGLGDRQFQKNVPNVITAYYPSPRGAQASTHYYIRGLEANIRRGQSVVRACMELQKKNFYPDVIFVHMGWGEGLYLKDIFPKAKLIGYFEFYYHFQGADVGFDPEFPPTFDDKFRIRTKNLTHLLSLEACDAGISPTYWQKKQFPPEFQYKISVIHEGIDSETVRPAEQATLKINDKILKKGDEILTYVARNLEPCRGVHSFLRSLPKVLKERPNCQVLIVGGDSVSYGKPPEGASSYKEKYLQEVQLDMNRVHFLGRISYRDFLTVLQISTAHVYFTYPFVLSWSMLEAMSAGCVVIGSKTPPVEEVISHNQNGLLVDFFDYEQIADTIIEALANPQKYNHLRENARQTIVNNYDFKKNSLPKYVQLINGLL